MNKEIKRNRPASTLIKEYIEKKKGRMSEARAELHRRFDYLDYSQQKKILVAHLKSSMSDRQWAYPRLLNYWDDSFMPIVKELWEEYHEERCSWSIIRYFPKDYIMEQFDTLSLVGRNYFHICLRFGGDDDFVIDKELLPLSDYLFVMYRIGKKISASEAMQILYSIAQEICGNTLEYDIDLRRSESRVESLYPERIRQISQAFYYITEMNIEKAINEFKEWSNKVSLDIEGDQEWINMQSSSRSDSDFNKKAYYVLIKVMMRNLPDQYKVPMPEIYKTPGILKLIDKLGLVCAKEDEPSQDLPF